MQNTIVLGVFEGLLVSFFLFDLAAALKLIKVGRFLRIDLDKVIVALQLGHSGLLALLLSLSELGLKFLSLHMRVLDGLNPVLYCRRTYFKCIICALHAFLGIFVSALTTPLALHFLL